MQLSAEYSERRGCPVCGKPARRLGRWYIANGSWVFEPQSVAVQGPRGELPEDAGELWQNHPASVEVTDPRTGLVSTKRKDQWFRIAHFECSAGRHDAAECCGVFNELETRQYVGCAYDWMLEPEPPNATDRRGVMGAVVELKTAWSAN